MSGFKKVSLIISSQDLSSHIDQKAIVEK